MIPKIKYEKCGKTHLIFIETTKNISRVYRMFPFGSSYEKKLPFGTAHFLEHIMFKKEDDQDFLMLFSEYEADINAYTSFDKTVYHYQTDATEMKHFEVFLEMTSTLHVTEELVENEKKIISEEIEMYENEIETQQFYTTFSNLCATPVISHDIAGTVESIQKITPSVLKESFEEYYLGENTLLIMTAQENFEHYSNVVSSFYNLLCEESSFEIYKNSDMHRPKFSHAKHDAYSASDDLPIVQTVLTSSFATTEQHLFGIEVEFNTLEEKLLFSFLSSLLISKYSPVAEERIRKSMMNSAAMYDIMNVDAYTFFFFENIGDGEYKREFLDVIEYFYSKTKRALITKETFESYRKGYLGQWYNLLDNDGLLGNESIALYRQNITLDLIFSFFENVTYETFVETSYNFSKANVTTIRA